MEETLKRELERMRHALELERSSHQETRQGFEQKLERERQDRERERQDRERERQDRERERQDRERERQDRERERQDRERERQDRERERQDRERLHQETTFYEFLSACHLYIDMQFDFTPRNNAVTKINGKRYPETLPVWQGYIRARERLFRLVKSFFSDRRLFTSVYAIQSPLVRNEADVSRSVQQAFGRPVVKLLEALFQNQEMRRRFACTAFEWRVEPCSGTPNGPACQVLGNRRKPDGSIDLPLLFELRAHFEITPGQARIALAKDTLIQDVLTRANRYVVVKDIDPQADAEFYLVAAIIQLGNSMVNTGTQYGFITTGTFSLFLHMDRRRPRIFEHYLSVPAEVVGVPSNDRPVPDDKLPYTPVAEILCFCLMSFEDENSGNLKNGALQGFQTIADRVLKRWPESYCPPPSSSGPSTGSSTSRSPSSRDKSYHGFRGGINPQHRVFRDSTMQQSLLSRRRSETHNQNRDADDNEFIKPEVVGLEAPNSGDVTLGEKTEYFQSSDPASIASKTPTKPYCTQGCLLGLKRGWRLDENCPNVNCHRTFKGSTLHSLDADGFTEKIQEQLLRDPYRLCEALDSLRSTTYLPYGELGLPCREWRLCGRLGYLFKLELAGLGYTFVGKGIANSYFQDPENEGKMHPLEHESNIYRQLDKLQGKVVPVHLGLVNFSGGYVLPFGDRIFELMLMSWAGVPVALAPGYGTEERKEMKVAVSEMLWDAGVSHNDVREENCLWNEERGCFMIFDFDMSTIHGQLPGVSVKEEFIDADAR